MIFRWLRKARRIQRENDRIYQEELEVLQTMTRDKSVPQEPNGAPGGEISTPEDLEDYFESGGLITF